MSTEKEGRMRLLCFGVGAIGTYLGGSLALSGHTVVFIERPDVAETIRAQGITIDQGRAGGRTGEHHLSNPNVVDSLEMALYGGPFDAAILAVKSFDTQSVVESIRPYQASFPPVLSFQNGVENEPAVAALLGADRVISGTVTTAVGRSGPGHVTVERLRGIGIATNHPLGTRLVPLMNEAGLRARGYANPAAMKWSKLLTNLIANASSAILDMTPAEIFAHPGLFAVEIRQLREALRVMQAMNIPVVDLPSTPVRALAWAVTRLPPSLSRPLLVRSVGKGRGAKMPSFHIDLHSGRGKSEVEYLNGAVARYGERYHAATPVNQTLTDILLSLTRGETPLNTYARQPDKLLAAIPDE